MYPPRAPGTKRQGERVTRKSLPGSQERHSYSLELAVSPVIQVGFLSQVGKTFDNLPFA